MASSRMRSTMAMSDAMSRSSRWVRHRASTSLLEEFRRVQSRIFSLVRLRRTISRSNAVNASIGL